MRTDRGRAIAEAFKEFGETVARLIEGRAAGPDWIDQTSCAPLSKKKFLAAIRDGDLPAHTNGKQRLVRREDFDRYIAKHPVGGAKRRALTAADTKARVLADLNLVRKADTER